MICYNSVMDLQVKISDVQHCPDSTKEEHKLKTRFLMFAATRYWTDRNVLEKTFEAIRDELTELAGEVMLIVDGDLSQVPERMDRAVILPMSGSVQRPILDAAGRCESVVLFAGYCAGNFCGSVTDKLLHMNAAPTLMDTWGVLRRKHDQAYLAVTRVQLTDILCAAQACDRMRTAKLILIGDTEPWVISNADRKETYRERLGVEIEQVSPDEVIARYEATTPDEARWLVDWYAGHADKMCGATGQDLENACRFGVALIKTLEAHEAQGGAIACFNLIARTGTNACLGVAYLNDCTDRFLACEGDLDSAVTMLLMRGLTSDGLWMANPCLDAYGRINFSHCTSLWHVAKRECPFVLRPHHETGVGVSLDVSLPDDLPLTLCRISDECSAMTIHTGHAVPGERRPVCHTQMWVDVDDYEHYLNTALGCHQVFAFEDVARRLKIAAQMLGLRIL